MITLCRRFLAAEGGISTIEYALIGAGASLVVAAAAPTIGGAVSALFTYFAGHR